MKSMFGPGVGFLTTATLVAALFAPTQARAIDVWNWDGTVLFHGAATVYGSLPAPGASGEIAMTQQTLGNGQSISLPTYTSDGTTADPSEVFWTVTLRLATVDTPPVGLLVQFNGLQADLSPNVSSVIATVFAVRSSPTQVEDGVQTEAFSQVKDRYR